MNKHLDFPLTSKINEETGVRDVINEMENENVYVDKVGLEDLITSHEAEFESIDVYYYDDGRNETINHAIESLYNLRRESSRDGY